MSTRPYPDVDPRPAFPRMEERILRFWRESEVFAESVRNRPAGPGGANEFVFYDGPPFANGLPHYGHLLTGYVKDVAPRYQTMRGRRVDRVFGWDCHGLPAEMEAEKELGISGRVQILSYGVDRFNDCCRTAVLRYAGEWESYVTRQGRWVDFEHGYRTMDTPYTESVLWAFKQLWDKGLIYEGYRVVPYSWACESTVSNFETRLDNAYRERQDPAITVMFTLDQAPGDPGPLKILAWTTTPWTLPSNLALAVGPDIDYAIMEEDGVRYVVGEAARGKYADQLKNARHEGTIRGSDLVGRTYAPLFPFFSHTPGAFRILGASFVDTQEGTGVVHLAPGFGEDDQVVCQENGVPMVCPVDNAGRFTSEVPPYAGRNVLETNKDIIRDLKAAGVLVKQESYRHNYPHCWRTDEPLIYKAVNSWYVRVSAFRERMVELNQQIQWIPEHIRDGIFGNWLAGARDWSISRSRFWGAPIPVWKSDDPVYPRMDVYGSLDEIERDFGVRPVDLHRPGIDSLTRPNPDDPTGRSTMRRVEEVLDCWFESGSMPFAQVHYPFEKREWFDNHFPSDFIVEYVAQTRGWFYTMMVLGTALFDRPPFRTCLCHGVVLDEKGQKLSKRLKNYPSPEEVFETYGSDALRWFLVSSPILRGGDLQIDREGKAIGEIVRLVINPIWNAYYFFCLYANTDGIKAELRSDSTVLLDRYILSRAHDLVVKLTSEMDAYDYPAACATIQSFIDSLNNWYIRRSRDRFWRHGWDADKTAAYNTVFTVLHVLCRAAAPLLPFLTEEVFKGLTGEKSVHLTDWPDPASLPSDPDVVEAIELVRDVCSTALSIRSAHALRVRQPLQTLTLATGEAHVLRPYVSLIAEEVNVRDVVFTASTREIGEFELQLKAAVIGPRFGAEAQKLFAAARQQDWIRMDDGSVQIAGHVLQPDDFTLRLKPRPGVAAQPLSSGLGVVVLDITLTPDLEQEGLARDVVRLIQQTRKDAGLHVADHIKLALDVPEVIGSAIRAYERYVSEQTLADALSFGPPEGSMYIHEDELAGERVAIALKKVR